jgi:hypothetical protein
LALKPAIPRAAAHGRRHFFDDDIDGSARRIGRNVGVQALQTRKWILHSIDVVNAQSVKRAISKPLHDPVVYEFKDLRQFHPQSG